jgi:hypothetical protein
VNTDGFGIAADRPPAREPGRQAVADQVRHSLYVPFTDPVRQMFVREVDSGKPSGAVKADARGFVTLSGLPASFFDIPCDIFEDGTTSTNACQGTAAVRLTYATSRLPVWVGQSSALRLSVEEEIIPFRFSFAHCSPTEVLAGSRRSSSGSPRGPS